MLSKSIVSIIASYASKYTDFVDWIKEKQINYLSLSRNPNAIHILEKNLDKVDWDLLSTNLNIFGDNKKQLVDILIKII